MPPKTLLWGVALVVLHVAKTQLDIDFDALPNAECTGGPNDWWRFKCAWCNCVQNNPECSPFDVFNCSSSQIENSESCAGECIGNPIWFDDDGKCVCRQGRKICKDVFAEDEQGPADPGPGVIGPQQQDQPLAASSSIPSMPSPFPLPERVPFDETPPDLSFDDLPDDECTGGPSDWWRVGCRWCQCVGKSPECAPATEQDCSPAQIENSEKCMGECIGSATWFEDCNKCFCHFGKAICTKKLCPPPPPEEENIPVEDYDNVDDAERPGPPPQNRPRSQGPYRRDRCPPHPNPPRPNSHGTPPGHLLHPCNVGAHDQNTFSQHPQAGRPQPLGPYNDSPRPHIAATQGFDSNPHAKRRPSQVPVTSEVERNAEPITHSASRSPFDGNQQISCKKMRQRKPKRKRSKNRRSGRIKKCSAEERAQCPEHRMLEYMLVRGCKPVYKKHRCCAIRFKCIKYLPCKLNGKCYYLGKFYKAGDRVPTSDPCRPSCYCNGPNIECAIISCLPPFPGCYQTYTLGKCCQTGADCVTGNTARCKYRGTQVFDGQRLNFSNGPLPDTCQECVCSSSYSGPFGQGCRKRYCGYDLSNQSQILAGCEPIFDGNRCCSTTNFLCPSSGIVVPNQGSSTGGKNKCRFGNIFLEKGAELLLTDPNIKCECLVPPSVLCTRI